MPDVVFVHRSFLSGPELVKLNPGYVPGIRSKILFNLIVIDYFVNIAYANLSTELISRGRVYRSHQTGVVEKRQRSLCGVDSRSQIHIFDGVLRRAVNYGVRLVRPVVPELGHLDCAIDKNRVGKMHSYDNIFFIFKLDERNLI